MQGIFVTCDRGKESKAMGEFTEHLEEVTLPSDPAAPTG